MFQHVDAYAGDPILSLNEAFQKDPRAGKINLSIGIYFDNDGRIPMMDSVRKAELAVVEIAHVAATHLFGGFAGRALSSVIALGLLSTIGAFVVTGTRVYAAMGREHRILSRLAPHSTALVVQTVLAAVMIATSSFDVLLASVGVTLSLSSALTVFAVLIVRHRGLPSHAYRTPGYPLTPLAFVALSLGTIVAAIADAPIVAVWGGLSIAVGAALYGLSRAGVARR